MLPPHSLSYTLTDGELVPGWCTARDLPWLRDLLHEAHAHVGRPRHELLRRWRTSDPDPRAGRLLAAARTVLLTLLRPARSTARARLRRDLFTAASTRPRADALAHVAADHDVPVATLLDGLFDDLGSARALPWPTPGPTPSDLLLAVNRAIAQTLLRSAHSAVLHLSGHSRTVLRTAWLRGVHFAVHTHGAATTTLHWRPPEHAPQTGRHLAHLLPVLPWARWFELRARCTVGRDAGTLVLTSHEALPPGPEPRAFDSRLEQRFAAAFALAAPDHELLREPVPVRCGDQLAFPDFLVRRRGERDGWWLEIAGLRDRGALAGKLALLQREARYVLCVPQRVMTAELRAMARVVPFGREVDVGAVLACLATVASGK